MQRFANNQPIEFIRFFNRTLVLMKVKATIYQIEDRPGMYSIASGVLLSCA